VSFNTCEDKELFLKRHKKRGFLYSLLGINGA